MERRGISGNPNKVMKDQRNPERREGIQAKNDRGAGKKNQLERGPKRRVINQKISCTSLQGQAVKIIKRKTSMW